MFSDLNDESCDDDEDDHGYDDGTGVADYNEGSNDAERVREKIYEILWVTLKQTFVIAPRCIHTEGITRHKTR